MLCDERRQQKCRNVARRPRCKSYRYEEGSTSKCLWEGSGARAPSSVAGAWATPQAAGQHQHSSSILCCSDGWLLAADGTSAPTVNAGWVFFPSPWHRFPGVRRDGETDLSPAGVNPPCSHPISVGCGGFSACFPLRWVVLAPLPALCQAVPWPAWAQAGCSVPCLFRKGGGEGVGRETCLPRYLVSHTRSLPGPRETSIHCAAGICSESKQWDPQRQQCPIVL